MVFLRMIALAAAAAIGSAVPCFPAEKITRASDPSSLISALGYAEDELSYSGKIDVPYGSVLQFTQRFRGCEVYGGGVNVSVDKDGTVLGKIDSMEKIVSVGKETLTREEALAAAGGVAAGEKSVFAEGGRAEYCYEIVSADGGTQLVSAADGRTLLSSPAYSLQMPMYNAAGELVELPVGSGADYHWLEDSTRNIAVYDADASGEIVSPCTDQAGGFDEMAVSVYESAIRAYDYFADPSNVGTAWRGIDGRADGIAGNAAERGEVPLYILVHYGRLYENANCGYYPEVNAAYMYVGDGRPGGSLYRQGCAADIIAHEYTHAVASFVARGGFFYQNESGALSEAFSDLFGALIEGRDPTEDEFWTIGENGVPEGKPPVRNMKLPFGDQKRNAKTKIPDCNLNHDHYSAGCDYGGTHSNSTIVTHAVYKMWKKAPAFFTRQTLGTLLFSTLAHLFPRATFTDFAESMLVSADALGFPEEAMAAVRGSLFSSGLLPQSGTHLVTFLNGKGQIYEELTVAHNGAAELPDPPVMEPTEEYTYVFSGWSGDAEHVTADLTLRALFGRETRKYRVTFLGAAGETLKEELVPYGTSATPPLRPQKQSDENFDYEFYLWDNSYSYITSDIVIRPVFREIPCYTVTFKDGDRVLGFERVREGESARLPAAPERESTRETEYEFTGWSGQYTGIRGDETVSALFSARPRRYTLRVLLPDGPREETVRYGDPLPLPAAPEREGYDFRGWYLDEAHTLSAEGATVTGDVVLYADWAPAFPTALVAGLSAGVVALLLAAGILLLRKKKK